MAHWAADLGWNGTPSAGRWHYLVYTFDGKTARVYDNGSFRTPEQSNTKQVMGKGTLYPFGASWRYQGLGLTGFWNYGWGDTSPDVQGRTEILKSDRAQFERVAAVLHYAAEEWNIAGEFDYGKNAFSLNNLYSGTGPADAFGTPTGPALSSAAFGNTCTPTATCYNVFNTFGPSTAVYQAILNNGRERNIGWDAFGHFHIPGTKLTAFGMFQWFLPNDNVRENPLDFQRFIAGVSYQYNEYLRFALDSQNLLFYHKQFGLTPADAKKSFGYNAGGTFNGQKLPNTFTSPASLDGKIPFLVPRDQHAIFFNVEFAY